MMPSGVVHIPCAVLAENALSGCYRSKKINSPNPKSGINYVAFVPDKIKPALSYRGKSRLFYNCYGIGGAGCG